MRTIVDLPDEDLQAVKALARHAQVSQAEVLRRAVRLYLETTRPELDPEAFGLWQGREDGVIYQRALRDEWSR